MTGAAGRQDTRRGVLPDTLAAVVAGLVAEPAMLARLNAVAAETTRKHFMFQGYAQPMTEALDGYAGLPTT